MTDFPETGSETPGISDWDFVIVGAGMAGSIVAGSLAQQGFKVVVLEYGIHPRPIKKASFFGKIQRIILNSDRAETLSAQGYWPHRVRMQHGSKFKDFYTGLGAGPGGSTALYSANLERFEPDDFDGLKEDDAESGMLPTNWPVDYATLSPFYDKIERLLEVCGTNDERGDYDTAQLRAPPPLSARDQDLFSSLEKVGLTPYRSHVAIRYKPGCEECAGIICQRQCKMSGYTAALKPALLDNKATLITGCKVIRFETNGDKITGAIVELDGKQTLITGHRFVLAAGGLNSPAILLRSKSAQYPHGVGNDNDMVGRGLMFHVSDFFAMSGDSQLQGDGPKKVLSSRAFYRHGGLRLGSFQSVGSGISASHAGAFIEGWLARTFRLHSRFLSLIASVLGRILAFHFRNGRLFATILEDYPYRENRIGLDETSASGFRIHYDQNVDLRSRTALFRSLLRKALWKHRPRFITGTSGLNYGHPSGTCRAGTDPSTSVVNHDGKVWGTRNLYVADASYFPSCAGTNPSLTIAANALRIADSLAIALGIFRKLA